MNYIMRNIGIKAGFLFVVLALAIGLTSCEKDYADAVSGSEEVVMVSSDAQNYPLTIHATKDAWKATSSATWLVLGQTEGIGTRDVELVIAQNISSATRTAHIDVKMQSGANTRIIVKQSGLGSTQIRLIPELITAKPYATAYAFRLSLQNAPASQNDITYEITNGKEWLSFVRVEAIPSSSFMRSFDYFFLPTDNLNADGREATVVFTVRFNHKVYTFTGAFYQNGLGAPAVATAENVYMRHNQLTHSQSVWLAEGNRDNVTFAKPVITSTQPGTNEGSSTDLGGWITDATIDNNGVLTIKAQANIYSEPREGDVYIVASRSNNPQINDKPGAATAKMRIHVSQAAHKDAGVSMPVSEVVHNYLSKEYTLPLQSLNDSKLSASTAAQWITGVSINANNQLVYTLSEYNGGQSGESREAIITIVAANGASNKASYYLTVRQYAPSMPGLDMPAKMVINYKENTYAVNANPINGSQIIEAYSMNSDWLTGVVISENKANLEFKVSEYQGGEAGESREGVVVVAVKNDHANLAYYYLTVMQNAPSMPALSVPTTAVTVNYRAKAHDMIILSQNNSVVTTETNVGWITNVVYDGTKLSYNVNEFNGGQIGESREGQIFLTATNSHANPVVYSITIKQFAPQMPALDLPATVVHNFKASEYALSVNATNGSTIIEAYAMNSPWIKSVDIMGNKSHIVYTLAEYNGGQKGESREGVIAIVVENDHKNKAMYYVQVLQYAPQMPVLSVPTAAVTVSYIAAKHDLIVSSLNNSKVITATNVEWINGVSYNGAVLSFDVDQFNGGQAGESREGQIFLTAGNQHINSVVYSITVKQIAPSMPALNLPSQKAVHNFKANEYYLDVNTLNGAKIVSSYSNSNWIKVDRLDDQNYINYYLSEYAGGQRGESREGHIVIVVENDHNNLATYYFHIQQNAPSMPAMSLPTAAVTHTYAAGDHMLAAFLQNNAKVVSVSTNVSWIRNVEHDGEVLLYDYEQYAGGQAGEFREGQIVIELSNANANKVAYAISVRQYAPASAGISQPVSQVTHNFSAATRRLPLSPINGSTLTADTKNDWITNVRVTNNNVLIYDLAEYAGGQKGKSREGVIAVTAKNNNANAVTFYIHVVQYAPEMPAVVGLPEVITLNSEASMRMLPMFALNNAKIKVSFDAEWVANEKNMQRATPTAKQFTLATMSYDGSAGDYRECTMTVTATNANSNIAVYNVLVRQFAPQMPGINNPIKDIAHNFKANTHRLPLSPNNNSVLTAESKNAWITDVKVNANNVLVYKVSKFGGGQLGASRQGVIAVTSRNGSNSTAIYYITITQYAPELPSVLGLPAMLTFSANEEMRILPIFAANNANVFISYDAGWIEEANFGHIEGENAFGVQVQMYDGAQGPYRECTMYVVATNANSQEAVYSIPVRQYAPVAAGMSVPIASVSHSYLASQDRQISLQPFAGTTLEAASEAEWISNVTITEQNMLRYDIDAFSGGVEGQSRQGVIAITATSDHATKAIYYITVIQYAPKMPALTALPEYIGLSGSDLSTLSFYLNHVNSAEVVEVLVSDPTWMDASMNGTVLEFKAISNFTGGVAPLFYREGFITLKAGNDNSQPVMYTIPVRQYNVQTASVPQIADGTTPESFLARSGVSNKRVMLVNFENVTKLSIDVNKTATRYPLVADDGVGTVSEVAGYLNFSAIMPASFEINAVRNTAAYMYSLGVFRDYYRSQQVMFHITHADMKTVVLTQNIYQY